MVLQTASSGAECSEVEGTPGAAPNSYISGFLDCARNDRDSDGSTIQRFNDLTHAIGLSADRALSQRVIVKDERSHCFDNRHGSWKNTRVMPSAGGQFSLLL